MMIDELNLKHNLPTTLEQLYYRILYNNKHFGDQYKVIPYFRMPKYGNTNDASARTNGYL